MATLTIEQAFQIGRDLAPNCKVEVIARCGCLGAGGSVLGWFIDDRIVLPAYNSHGGGAQFYTVPVAELMRYSDGFHVYIFSDLNRKKRKSMRDIRARALKSLDNLPFIWHPIYGIYPSIPMNHHALALDIARSLGNRVQMGLMTSMVRVNSVLTTNHGSDLKWEVRGTIQKTGGLIDFTLDVTNHAGFLVLVQAAMEFPSAPHDSRWFTIGKRYFNGSYELTSQY